MDSLPGGTQTISARFDLQGGVDHDTTIDTTHSSIYVWMLVTKTGTTATADVSFTIHDKDNADQQIASGSGTGYSLSTTPTESRVYVSSGGTLPAWHRMYISISFTFPVYRAEAKGDFSGTILKLTQPIRNYIYGATILENALLTVFFAIVIPYIARKRCTVNLFPKKISHRHHFVNDT